MGKGPQKTANRRLFQSIHGWTDCSPIGLMQNYRDSDLICFLPKSRASIDQAPGPIIARVAPRVAKTRGSQKSPPPPEKAIHNSRPAMSAPAIGVHRPTKRRSVAPASINCATSDACCATPWKRTIRQHIKAAAVIKRWRRRPTPGNPLANVENRRCRGPPT